MATSVLGRSRIEEGVSQMRTFTQGNVSARWHDEAREGDRGRLSPNIVLPATRHYVVYSYKTPIAWYCLAEATWYMPSVYYSPTTDRHQMMVLEGIGGEES